jgi:hypothetical protein
MSPFGSRPGSAKTSSRSVSGLSEIVRAHGCPMMDDTLWEQTESGEFFTSPEGIGTAGFWLPCASTLPGEVALPGTCVDCEYHRLQDHEKSSSVDGA